jgi:hypothetical protein
MGDDHGRAAIFVADIHDQGKNLLGGLVTEGAVRLVAEQELRLLHQRAPDRAALLLASRYLRRELVALVPEPQRPEQPVHIERIFRKILAYLDVLANREVLDEVIELEDEAKSTAPVLSQSAVRERCEICVVNQHAASIGTLEASYEIEKRRLSGV